MATPRPFRIVHCVRSPAGGLLRHLADLARAQSAMGHSVGIICDSTTIGRFEAAALESLEPVLALGLLRLPMKRQVSAMADLSAIHRMYRPIRDAAPDVIHCHGAKAGVYGRTIGALLRLRGRRPVRIYTPHGGSLHYDPRSTEGRIYFGFERAMQRFTDGFVFVSDYEKNTFTAKVGAPRAPHIRVHNGVSLAECEPIPPSPAMADFAYVGMLRDLKGPDVLIEALAILRGRDRLRVTARFVGSGPDRERYEARVAELGLADAVTFTGPLPTHEALAQGRIVVVPSRAESLPYIVLETAAARVPMLATRVGGIPEIFGPETPRLLPPGDADALASAMAMALADEPTIRRHTEALGGRVEAQFSIDRMTRDIVGFYAELLAGQRPSPAAAGEAARAAERKPTRVDHAA